MQPNARGPSTATADSGGNREAELAVPTEDGSGDLLLSGFVVIQNFRRHRGREPRNLIFGNLLPMKWVGLNKRFNLGQRITLRNNHAASARLFATRHQELASRKLSLKKQPMLCYKAVNFRQVFDVM
jgi:hypothetical protein